MPVFDYLARVVNTMLLPGGAGGRLLVFFYHRVLAEPDPLMPNIMWAEPFARHLELISRVFRVIPLAEAVEQLYSGTLPERAVCITFDDGYRDNASVVLPMLLQHKVPATFFLATGFLQGGLMFNDVAIECMRRAPSGYLDLGFLGLGSVQVGNKTARAKLAQEVIGILKYMSAEARTEACSRLSAIAGNTLQNDLMMRPEDVRALARAGMEVGGHTINHPILTRLSDADALEQIRQNRSDLAHLIGYSPRSFAYPNGKPLIDYHAKHVEMVRSAGYSFALSTAYGAATEACDRFQLPRVSPSEISRMQRVAPLLRLTMSACVVTEPQQA